MISPALIVSLLFEKQREYNQIKAEYMKKSTKKMIYTEELWYLQRLSRIEGALEVLAFLQERNT